MKIIANEEHYNPTCLTSYLQKTGAFPGSLRGDAGISGIPKRLQDMADAGIDMQVLSVGMLGLHNVPVNEAAAMSREMDDEIADVVKSHPGKFAGLAAIAAQDPAGAADELERAVTKLGFKGAMINSHVNGEYLDEPKFRVIMERFAALKVPLYIHPNLPSPDMIKPYMKYPQITSAAWGFAAETGLHAVRLVCSGIFDELPDLKIVLGHMGESIPFWLWRMDRHWQRETPNGRHYIKKPSEYMKDNFYVTTSGMFWPTVIQFVYLALGAENILFGVDYPLESNKLAVQAIENTPMCSEDKAKIFYRNAEKIFNLL